MEQKGCVPATTLMRCAKWYLRLVQVTIGHHTRRAVEVVQRSSRIDVRGQVSPKLS